MKHLLKLSDLSKDELTGLLNLADELKKEQRAGGTKPYLKGKSLGMIFQKSSTRTRVSFETGIFQLGGQGLFLSPRDLQIGRGEPARDTARVLSRYLDGLMIRTFAQQEAEDFAHFGSIPVINGLTDYCHPCQVLADLMTIRERRGSLEGLKLCYVGDGNNMANSLMVGGLLAGMEVAISTPRTHRPHPDVIDYAGSLMGGNAPFALLTNPMLAAADADVVVTDVWASMGQEAEAEERKKIFSGYAVTEELMSCAKSDALVLHCLPAHRGEEISEAVFEKHADEIFDEAENRLHAQKAVMVALMGNR